MNHHKKNIYFIKFKLERSVFLRNAGVTDEISVHVYAENRENAFKMAKNTLDRRNMPLGHLLEVKLSCLQDPKLHSQARQIIGLKVDQHEPKPIPQRSMAFR